METITADQKITSENIDALVAKEVEARLELIEESEYDQMLDDCYESYQMGDMEFYPSDILKSCDPTAYRCGMADYTDSEYERVEDDVRGELEALLDD